jgi:hypothetical protein
MLVTVLPEAPVAIMWNDFGNCSGDRSFLCVIAVGADVKANVNVLLFSSPDSFMTYTSTKAHLVDQVLHCSS